MKEEGRNCDYDETEHISGHLWHRYTVKAQVMKVRVKFRSGDFNLTIRLSNLLVVTLTEFLMRTTYKRLMFVI